MWFFWICDFLLIFWPRETHQCYIKYWPYQRVARIRQIFFGKKLHDLSASAVRILFRRLIIQNWLDTRTSLINKYITNVIHWKAWIKSYLFKWIVRCDILYAGSVWPSKGQQLPLIKSTPSIDQAAVHP